jgi:hypothetical protein
MQTMFRLAFNDERTAPRTAQDVGLTFGELNNGLKLMDYSYSSSNDELAVWGAERGYRVITYGVLKEQNRLISAMLAAHVRGYSTTTGDLFHDLKP